MLRGQTIPNLLPVGVADVPLLPPFYSPPGGRCVAMPAAHAVHIDCCSLGEALLHKQDFFPTEVLKS